MMRVIGVYKIWRLIRVNSLMETEMLSTIWTVVGLITGLKVTSKSTRLVDENLLQQVKRCDDQ